jgi:glycosyltransferase involved in cell wall biosynthesis
MWRGLSQVDVVWAWGPHPFSILLITFAVLRRKRVALCVRENTLEYHRQRLPSRLWFPILGAVWGTEAVYRLLARRLPTTAVGAGVAQRYASPGSTVLPIAISLVRAEDVVASPPKPDWTGEISLLTVGRLEPEKNPLLLIDALGLLEADHPGRFRLVWVGRGTLEEEVRRRTKELGLENVVELRGYIPFGPELLAFYRQAHAFVHVSLTEGLPQVLIEALAAGLPIVATNVGGVASALDGGRAGLLVPPADVDALVGAVRRLCEDEALREAMVTRGLHLARQLTLERQAAQVAGFIADGVLPARA